MTSSGPIPDGYMGHHERLPIPGDGMAVAVSDDGNIAVQLPDGRPAWICGPMTARAIAEALTTAAEVADRVRATITAAGN